MDYRTLGKSGLKVSALSFGAGTFGGGSDFFKAWGASDDVGAARRMVDALDAVAQETKKSVPEIALNWLLARPTVASVIMGARDEAQLRQNLSAAGWTLTPSQRAALDKASDAPRAYPYWHQQQFVERTPPAVPATTD